MLNKLTTLIAGVSPLTWVIAAVAGLGVLVMVLYINSVFNERKQLIAETAALEVKNSELRAQAAALKKSLDDNLDALRQTEARREESRQAEIKSDEEIKKLNETDPQVCGWSSGVVPDAVWDWLCGSSNDVPGASTTLPADGVPHVDP
jgi:uncharacterized protein YlxW (UPF0749 family)